MTNTPVRQNPFSNHNLNTIPALNDAIRRTCVNNLLAQKRNEKLEPMDIIRVLMDYCTIAKITYTHFATCYGVDIQVINYFLYQYSNNSPGIPANRVDGLKKIGALFDLDISYSDPFSGVPFPPAKFNRIFCANNPEFTLAQYINAFQSTNKTTNTDLAAMLRIGVGTLKLFQQGKQEEVAPKTVERILALFQLTYVGGVLRSTSHPVEGL